MKRTYLDTETTGLVLYDRPLSDPSQPHLVELGALLVDDSRDCTLAAIDTLIYPATFDFMPEDVLALHGITYDDCLRHGMDLLQALSFLSLMVLSAKEIVVANMPFEWAMAQMSAARAGTPNLLSFMQGVKWRDTTTMGREVFPNLPLASHGRGPRQKDIYRALFGEEHTGKHRALSDATQQRRIFLALDAILSGRHSEANASPSSAGDKDIPENPLAGPGPESPPTSLLAHAVQHGDVGLPPMRHNGAPLIHPFVRKE